MPSATRTHSRPVAWGDWNVCIGAFGVPGTGKSEWALRRVVELQRRYGCYVLAHAPGPLRPAFHDGASTGVVNHPDVASCRAALKVPGRLVHAIGCRDAADVVALARELAAAELRRHPYRLGQPTVGVPVLVYLDEAISAADASPRQLGDDMRDLLTRRRHLHIGLVYTVQSPWFVHYSMISLATECAIFRLRSRRDFVRLEEAGIEPRDLVVRGRSLASLEALRELPRYHYAHVVVDESATR